MEDEYNGYPSQMAQFGSTFRSTNPNTPIICSSYGDPTTRWGAGGGAWPYAQMCYWGRRLRAAVVLRRVVGVPQLRRRRGDQAGPTPGAAPVCGSNFPMSPELSIYSAYSSSGILPTGDITTGENYGKAWKAPIFWWEYSNMNATIAKACLA